MEFWYRSKINWHWIIFSKSSNFCISALRQPYDIWCGKSTYSNNRFLNGAAGGVNLIGILVMIGIWILNEVLVEIKIIEYVKLTDDWLEFTYENKLYF